MLCSRRGRLGGEKRGPPKVQPLFSPAGMAAAGGANHAERPLSPRARGPGGPRRKEPWKADRGPQGRLSAPSPPPRTLLGRAPRGLRSTHPGDTWGPAELSASPPGRAPLNSRLAVAEAPLPATCPGSAALRSLLLPLPPFVPSSSAGGPRTKGPAPPSASASGRRDSPAGPTRQSRSLLPPPPPC